jgi:GTP-binding protein
MLRAGLADYELFEEDTALLAELEHPVVKTEPVLPVVAVVGRPNVGKSTLVNRILGRREAVVDDMPGVTRDRVSYEAEWAGTDFTLVDTGGWEVDVAGLTARVAAMAEVAIGLADVVVFVVDATVGPTATDEQVVRLLRSAGKPVVLAANKVDSPKAEADVAYLWSLGLGEPYAISALHGRGIGDLLDVIVDAIPDEPRDQIDVGLDAPRRVALVGRPNVGKSSLLNKLAQADRVVVDSVPGTTRDPVDELIHLDGRPWWFIDTAGIRRRVQMSQGADFYAYLRTAAAIEKAEVAVVLLDASEPLSEQDVRVIGQVVEAGRALVIAFNKWDVVDEDRRNEIDREVSDLAHVAWAPRINVSALTGWHTNRLVPALDRALAGWDTRIPTGQLNAFLGELVAAHPHPVRGGKQPRILFATQADIRPPRFVLFTTGFLEPGYRRFIERKLRETFDFTGTPIALGIRVREKRRR